jgi:hypothetical protein
VGSYYDHDSKSGFFYEKINQPWKTDLVICSSHYNENLEWLENSPYQVVIVSKKDAPGAIPSSLLADTIRVPNLGNEAGSYLAFIIRNYSNLPPFTAFIHGHESAWHQNHNLLELIARAKIEQYDYISLNNNFIVGETEKSDFLLQWWPIYMENVLNIKLEPLEAIESDCCAQFIVSKETILRIPLEAYKRWYHWILNEPSQSGTLGYFFEYSWAMIFGQPKVLTDEEISTYMEDHFEPETNEHEPMSLTSLPSDEEHSSNSIYEK